MLAKGGTGPLECEPTSPKHQKAPNWSIVPQSACS